MKKYLLTVIFLISFLVSQAKYLKFSVDMTGQIVSSNGVHVSGDFQTVAGYSGGNFQPNTTLMVREGTTEIYSVVVKVPAFAKYEYFFVNGDQFYEAEFVPVESRIQHNFVDNRWLYLDSLRNDTFSVGAILFSGNAPINKKLVRLQVNMKRETISSKGVHIAGDFMALNSENSILYSFVNNLYEIIIYTDSTTNNHYRFYNGNVTGSSEVIPAACMLNNSRYITAINDTILKEVCFSSCTLCSTSGLSSLTTITSLEVIPNPSSGNVVITFTGFELSRASLYNLTGQWIQDLEVAPKQILLAKGQLTDGVYIISLLDSKGVIHRSKVIFN